MKKLFLFCFIAMLLQACKEPLPEVPADVIAMDKMKLILADIHIADAVAETKAQGGGNENLLTQEYYAQIFKNRGITREEFNRSYTFYQHTPVLIDKLYEDVLTELSTRNAHVSK